MNAVSLFAGVGGFDLALERNGVKVVASVEIDKKASAVLAKHFPQSKLFDDVCKVTGRDFIDAGFTPENGIMVGGFPCQDLSVAGKRAGLAGNRSGLFFEFLRLIEETKTKFVILENVPGLLSSNNGNDMGVVIGALDDLGYSLAWRVLDAQFFGVPQRRRRVFIIGCLGDDWRTPAEIFAIAEGRAGYLAQGKSKRKSSPSTTSDSFGAFSESSFGQYSDEFAGTLRASGGVAGGGQRNLVGALQARDFKGVGSQYVEENKLVLQKQKGIEYL